MKKESIKVTLDRTATSPITKYILGNFIENSFGRQINGMWAEMINNRSFREIPPYADPTWQWLGFGPEYYNENAPFWHSGYEECDWELMAPEHASKGRLHGQDSHKGMDTLYIYFDGKSPEAGLRQKGIYVKAGELYDFSIFGSFDPGFFGRVSPAIACYGDESQAEIVETKEMTVLLREEANPSNVVFSKVFSLESTQRQFDTEILINKFTGRAILEISFNWEGNLLLSWCSMMPRDTVHGWRKDVVELLKKVGPKNFRLPGGCFVSFHDWRDAVGPRNERSPKPAYYWGGLEENDVGIDEYLELCHELKAEPQVCINMMTSTPFKASELVEYCNGADDSSMGRFRKENGVIRKNKATYWEMENEAGRKWSALQYAQKIVDFSTAMKGVDKEIKIMMEFYSFGIDWLPDMLKIAGQHIDMVIHRNVDKSFLIKCIDILRKYNTENDTDIKLVNTEWLADGNSPEPLEDPDVPQYYVWDAQLKGDYKKVLSYRQIHWFYALNTASAILDFYSLGGEFFLANFNNCANTWGQNIIEASKEGAWLSPAGKVFEFFSHNNNKYPLYSELNYSNNLIKVQCCETDDSRGLNVYLINFGSTDSYISLELPSGYKIISSESLSAPKRLCTNTLATDSTCLDKIDIDFGNNIKLKFLSITKIYCAQ